MAAILVVDDEKNIRTHLTTYLDSVGHRAESATDATGALAVLERAAIDVVLSDVRMAGMDGLALLREIRRRWPGVVVVLMTAYATVPQAVEAMRDGAYDYLVKPFSLDQVGLLLARVLEVQALRRENETLRRALTRSALLESRSPAMQRVLDTAHQVADSDATVLLTGESGTGKNVLAAAVHGWSARRDAPFVTIACTALSEHLLESELFGHVRGAFTGAWKDKPGRLEGADGGTVFLDEVGDLSGDLQAKLLRFVEEHRFERVGGGETVTVDARVITATNRDLAGAVAAGRFRQDLYFRLNVVGIHLPPLRERLQDLPALTAHILAQLKVRHGKEQLVLADEVMAALAAYRWPGNIRELVNVLERTVVLARDVVVRPEDLPDSVLAPPPPMDDSKRELSLDDLKRRHIREVLDESATLEEAAARLGINPTTLWRHRKRYGLD